MHKKSATTTDDVDAIWKWELHKNLINEVEVMCAAVL